MIERHTNGKWYGIVKRDSTRLSTHGMGGACYTTLHRALKIMLLGFLISLRAVLFCNGIRRSYLAMKFCGAASIFNICELMMEGIAAFNFGLACNCGDHLSFSLF